MRAQPVVVIHQVVADIPLGFPQAHVPRGRKPFRLEAPEQPLHRRVIPAVATPTHALGHAIAPQPLPKYPAAVLAALVGVKQHARRAAPLLIRHVERFHDQLSIRPAGHRPAHDPPGVEVEHRGQVMPAATCPYISDVAAPHLIGLLDIKFTRQKIGNILSFRPRDLLTMSSRLFGDQPGFLHQATHLEPTNLMPKCPHH